MLDRKLFVLVLQLLSENPYNINCTLPIIELSSFSFHFKKKRGALLTYKKNPLENYYKEISEVELLKPHEEIELAVRIRKNDKKALNKLVNSNLRFVITVARSYQNKGLSLEDLINEGNLGLLQAALRFDETRGFKFISYAVWWIRQAILQAIAEKTRTIRLPLNRIGTLTKISKVYNKLEQELERAPTPDEVSGMLDIDPDNISFTVSRASRVVSLDSPLSPNTNNRLVDVVIDEQPGPDSDLMHNSLKDDIKFMLNDLPYREAKILKLYFGLDGEKPHTLEDVGREFKLTRERIRQIKEKALKKLLTSSRSKLLQQYL